MKNGSSSPRNKPPFHVPVLTEVVQLHDQETVPGALMMLPDVAPPEDPPEAEPGPSLFEGRPVPEWLLKKQERQEPTLPPSVAPSPVTYPADWTRALRTGHDDPQPSREQEPEAADHYIPDTASGFSSSWWMNDQEPEPPTVSVSAPQPLYPTPVPEPVPTPPPAPEPVPQFVLDESQMVQRVLLDLDRQVGMMFEHRMREALVPAFARATDALMRELRQELALNLREMVARAVAMELARHGRSAGSD